MKMFIYYKESGLNTLPPPGCARARAKTITGLAAYAGYILGYWEADRRSLMNVYHEGAIIFVLMITCIVSALVVYDWIGFLVRKYLLKGNIVADGAASQVGCLRHIPYCLRTFNICLDIHAYMALHGVNGAMESCGQRTTSGDRSPPPRPYSACVICSCRKLFHHHQPVYERRKQSRLELAAFRVTITPSPPV